MTLTADQLRLPGEAWEEAEVPPPPDPELERDADAVFKPRRPREEWRTCRSYPRYQVSSLGRVRDTQTGQLKTVSISARCSERTAYATVSLNVCKGRSANVYVHRLVAEAFLFMGPIPPGTKVCHKNDVSSDCRASNLYIGTAADNARDCKVNGGREKGRHKEIARQRAEGFARMRAEVAASNAAIKPRPHAPRITGLSPGTL